MANWIFKSTEEKHTQVSKRNYWEYLCYKALHPCSPLRNGHYLSTLPHLNHHPGSTVLRHLWTAAAFLYSWVCSSLNRTSSFSLTAADRSRNSLPQAPAEVFCGSTQATPFVPVLPILIAAGKSSDSSYRGQISWGRVTDKGHRQNSFLSLPLIIPQTREKLQNWALKSVCLSRMRKTPKQLYTLFYLKTDWSFLHHKFTNSKNPPWSEANEQASS